MGVEQGIPREPLPEQIAWARHLLRRQRNVVLGTIYNGEPHMSVLYSSFTFDEGDVFRARWRSFPETRHSVYIDQQRSQVAAPVGYTAVKLLLFDSASPNIAVKMNGHARRVPEAEVPEAIERMGAVRARRGDDFKVDRPEVPYEAVINEVMISVPLLTKEGAHVGETYAPIPLDALVGFDAPEPRGMGPAPFNHGSPV